MNITTNNKPRPLVSWDDVPVAHREAWLDYVPEDAHQDLRFFKYGDWWYDTHEFCLARGDLAALGWAVWQTQSVWDAVLVKYSDDYENVIVAHAAW